MELSLPTIFIKAIPTSFSSALKEVDGVEVIPITLTRLLPIAYREVREL
jgi:hypothetical protein